MDDRRPDTLDPARSAVFSYERWRENFLRLVLVGATVVGLVVAVVSSLDVVRAGNPQLAYVYGASWIVLLVIALRRWPYLLRAAILLALTYALGVSGLLENGMRGDARLFFLGLTVMTAMLVNVRAALLVSAGSLLTIVMVAVLVLSGTVHLASRITAAGTPDLWVVSSLDLALLQTVVLTGWFLFLREFASAQEETRRTLEALDQERTLLRTVIDHLPDAVYAKDSQGRRQLSNQVDADLLGVPNPSEALGRTGAEALDEAEAAQTLAQDQEVLRTGSFLLNHEVALPGPGGSTRWLLVSKLPLRSASGEIVGMVGIDRDITERKQADMERARLEEQLRLSQRLESMGRLAGGLAHDINNLLLPILGYTELLLTDLPTGEELKEGLGQIKGAALRTRDLSRKLLAFGRGQPLQLRPLDLRETVGAFGKLLARTVRSDVSLELQLPPRLGLVRADPGALEQILLNLVMNAQEAMPKGGRLSIELEDREIGEEDLHAHRDLAAGLHVCIRVTDTGTGMDAATASKIFEPFFTTKPHGTGLGLATTYGLVQEHGGAIEVRSEPGRGTEFTVLLPRCPEGLGAPSSSDMGEGQEGLRGTETILVVDDSDSVRELVSKGLGRLGYRVLTAASAEQAMEVSAREAEVDLLLADVVMPGMDGVELARGIRAARPEVKVLFISGYEREAVARRGVVEGGTSMLPKPFLLEDLARSVRAMFLPTAGTAPKTSG